MFFVCRYPFYLNVLILFRHVLFLALRDFYYVYTCFLIKTENPKEQDSRQQCHSMSVTCMYAATAFLSPPFKRNICDRVQFIILKQSTYLKKRKVLIVKSYVVCAVKGMNH